MGDRLLCLCVSHFQVSLQRNRQSLRPRLHRACHVPPFTFRPLPESVAPLINTKLPADNPGAGIFRRVWDTPKVDSNASLKLMCLRGMSLIRFGSGAMSDTHVLHTAG